MLARGRTASNSRTLFGQRDDWGEREARLLELTRCQHGVVSHTQLRSLGFAGATIRHRVAAGRLHVLHFGIYALGRPDLPVEGRWMAAVLACGPGALLSHMSAAALHELLSSAHPTVDVTVPRRVGLSRPRIRVHRSTWLRDADRAVERGVPCTSVARTLLDLAAVVNRHVLERACDQAEVLRLIDWSVMDELVAGARGRAGVGKLRAVLSAGDLGHDVPSSVLEGRFLALCRRADLPKPAVNQWLTVAGEEIQVDFVWRGLRLIVETDGFRTHRTRRAFQQDRRRDRLLGLAGWRVVRFTWDDVTSDPAHVTAVLRSLLVTPTFAS
jgi:hypothetical protein